MRHVVFIGFAGMILLILLFPAGAEQTGPDTKTYSYPPPSASAYNGDFVTITKPGKYTLERDIIHVNKAGLLIGASSVFLDGMGHTIAPALTGTEEEHIGVVILGYDGAGDPVRGVTITNITISEEKTAVSIGDTSSSPGESGFCESVIARNLTISDNEDGIMVYHGRSCGIENNIISNNTGTGLLISGMQTDVTGNTISSNDIGILVRNADKTTISGNIITGNKKAGLIGEEATSTVIADNILVNTQNILISGDETGYQFFLTPVGATNIVGGTSTGGNAWGTPDKEDLLPPDTSDTDNDGFYDSPVLLTEGLTDQYPLVWSGPDNTEGTQNSGIVIPAAGKEITEEPVIPEEITPIATPLPTPVPEKTVSIPKSTISGLHARIIGDTIPDTLAAGTKTDVSLTLYNDGTETWYSDDAIGVHAKEDATLFGPAWIPIPADIRLDSKSETQVHFTLTAKKNPGTYNLVYFAGKQKEGVIVTFGRAYKKQITIP
ncbi:MAG: right-handed parallel beta-helix repeat-containing protein [Methanospirillaceae archaeon]|nr:right-handed parallel beta-helix repeat-containing protein [Methanospirillaceae archaeon]